MFIWRWREKAGESGVGGGRVEWGVGEEKKEGEEEREDCFPKPLSFTHAVVYKSLGFATRKSLRNIRKVTCVQFSFDELNL